MDDEAEWQAIEDATEVQRGPNGSLEWKSWAGFNMDRSAPFKDAPHPKSYGAKLPMRGLGLGTIKKAHKWKLTAEEKKAGTPKTAEKASAILIRASAPHPASYGSDLPLRGLGLVGGFPVHRWTLSKEEKAAIADRPVRYANA